MDAWILVPSPGVTLKNEEMEQKHTMKTAKRYVDNTAVARGARVLTQEEGNVS